MLQPHHSSTLLTLPLSRKWGWSTDRMGPRGAPARQYASSTNTPHDRSIFKARLQLSLLPRDVTRTTARGVLKKSNLCRISPKWAKKLCSGPMWRFFLEQFKNIMLKTEIVGIILRLTWRCCCPLLGWMMASPLIITLSWSEGQTASSWSRSTDTTPEQMREIVNRKHMSEIMTTSLFSPS